MEKIKKINQLQLNLRCHRTKSKHLEGIRPQALAVRDLEHGAYNVIVYFQHVLLVWVFVKIFAVCNSSCQVR